MKPTIQGRHLWKGAHRSVTPVTNSDGVKASGEHREDALSDLDSFVHMYVLWRELETGATTKK